MTSQQLVGWVGTHVPVFHQMQTNDYAKHLGVMIGPGGAAHKWTGPGKKFLDVCARIRSSSRLGF